MNPEFQKEMSELYFKNALLDLFRGNTMPFDDKLSALKEVERNLERIQDKSIQEDKEPEQMPF